MEEAHVIKVYLIIVLYFSLNFISYGQENVSIYANENNDIFVFNFNINRYCYYAENNYSLSVDYSFGGIIKKGDTIIIKSDYDKMKLPFNVKSINNSNIKENNKIIINLNNIDHDPFNDAAYKFEKKSLFLIINNSDTIKLNNDTITYIGEINNFYIASMTKIQLAYIENFDSSLVYSETITNYQTKVYSNINNCNYFEITFYLNLDNEFKKTLNDTIIFKNSIAIWYYDKKKYMNLKKITFKNAYRMINYCKCWNKKGKLNFTNY